MFNFKLAFLILLFIASLNLYSQTLQLELTSKVKLKSKYGKLDSLKYLEGDNFLFTGDQKKISRTNFSNAFYSFKKSEFTKPVKTFRYKGNSKENTSGLTHFKTLKLANGIVNVWQKNLKDKSEIYMEVLDGNLKSKIKLKQVFEINNMNVAAAYQALIGGNYTMSLTKVECDEVSGKILFVYPVFENGEETGDKGYFVLNKELNIESKGKFKLNDITSTNSDVKSLGSSIKEEGLQYIINEDGTFLVTYFEMYSFKHLVRKKELNYIVYINPQLKENKVIPFIGKGYKLFGANIKLVKDKLHIGGIYKNQKDDEIGVIKCDVDIKNVLSPIVTKKKISGNNLSELKQVVNLDDENSFFVDNNYIENDGNSYIVLSNESYEIVRWENSTGLNYGTDTYISKNNFAVVCVDPFSEINWIKNFNRKTTYNLLSESNNDVKILTQNNKCFVVYMNNETMTYTSLNNTNGTENETNTLSIPENKKGLLFSGEFIEKNNELYGVAIKSKLGIQHKIISVVGFSFVVPGLTYYLIAKNRAQFYTTKLSLYKISLK